MNRAASERLYLALDQGGHASRALVFDGRGALLAKGLEEVRVRHPQPGWVEQDPEELVASLHSAAAAALRQLGARAARPTSAGLATQRASIVCWDRVSGAALSPVISWQDVRAHAWLEQFAPRADDIHRRTGLRLSAHYGASKLRWCLEHLPAVAAAHREGRLAFGPLAAFLIFRLLEERPLLVDPANAARTLLWNLTTMDWDPELLALFGLPRAALPACVPTRHRFGDLQVGGHALALEILTGDQSAALFAHGAPRPDTAYINMGTGAFIQRALGRHPGDAAGLLTGVVFRDDAEVVYTLEGTVNGAGAALQWLEEEHGLKDVERDLPGWLDRDGAPPLFLNGVSGLGAPFWVPDFPSGFIGAGEPWQHAVAVAESIVFLLQVNLEELRRHDPAPREILVTGGLSWYDGLCRRLADLSGLPVYRPAEYESTARGLAYLLAGRPAAWPEPRPGTWFQPEQNPTLQERHRRWRAEMQRALGN